MSAAIAGLLYGWNKNTEYAPKLVADLSEEQMWAAIAPAGQEPANHPAWIFSHLNTYLPIIADLIEGREFPDPREAPFGMLSHPESRPGVYANRSQLVEQYVAGHARVERLLRAADPTVLEQPMTLPRWAALMPQVGIALAYLMLFHEGLHLGQLSAWRRVQGLPRV